MHSRAVLLFLSSACATAASSAAESEPSSSPRRCLTPQSAEAEQARLVRWNEQPLRAALSRRGLALGSRTEGPAVAGISARHRTTARRFIPRRKPEAPRAAGWFTGRGNPVPALLDEGAVVFELLSGQLPFVADGPGKVLGMHILTPPPLLKDVAPYVPPPLADLVQRLLVKDRDKRPTMAEVVAELTALGEQHPLPRQASGPPSASESAVDPLRATGLQAPSTLGNAASQAAMRPPLKWRRMLALTVAGALALAALVLYVLVKTSPRFALTAERFQRGIHLMWHAADPEPGPSPAALPQHPAASWPAQKDASTAALLGAPEPVRDTPALPPRPGPPLPELRLADAPGAVSPTSPGLSGSPGGPKTQPAPRPALKPHPKKSYVAKRPHAKWRGKHKFVRRRRR